MKRRDFLKSLATAVVVGPEILKALPAPLGPIPDAAFAAAEEATLTWETLEAATATLGGMPAPAYLQRQILNDLAVDWACMIDERGFELLND